MKDGPLSKCRHILDEIVGGHQQVKEVYGDVLNSLRAIETFITNKVELSDSCIAIAMSEKQGTSKLPIIPVRDNATEEELIKTMECVNHLSDQLVTYWRNSTVKLKKKYILLTFQVGTNGRVFRRFSEHN